ncbi:MAG: Asp-tRNA(Asn)/Glu-tRNA(Gln) amidotransferase GatCAB subunit B, partial [Nesterenkonia sp.]|nr:Asp-tRNA(Asn)/Glu-tRNA(Gln) amidotransferase GatCAB subunit B [Nesterenkonia sp.]
IREERINDKIARQVLELHVDGEGAPTQIVEDRGLEVVSDDGALTAAVEKAMAENPDVVEKVAGGKLKAIGALIGPVMKETKGQADAGKVREIVLAKLGIEG